MLHIYGLSNTNIKVFTWKPHLFVAQSGKYHECQSWSDEGSCRWVCVTKNDYFWRIRALILINYHHHPRHWKFCYSCKKRALTVIFHLMIGLKRFWMKFPKPPWPLAGLARHTRRRLPTRRANLLGYQEVNQDSFSHEVEWQAGS